MRPLLAGTEAPWRRSFLYAYYHEGGYPGLPTILATRTADWKYVVYPDIDDIPELYNLKSDPHEMTNLAENPDHRAKRDEMAAELKHLMDHTHYTPATRRKPTPRATPYTGPPKLVLHYPFDKDPPDQALDASGHHNHGKVAAAPLAEGKRGRGRRFDGAKSHIAVAKSPSLDPALAPLTVAAWVRSERPDGIVLARGGKSFGYALYLSGGRPRFAIRNSDQATELEADVQLVGRWAHLAASLTAKAQLVLYVDGKPVARKQGRSLITAEPHDVMQLGTDLASGAGTYPRPLWFRGTLDDVRITRGELPPAEIAKLAAAP